MTAHSETSRLRVGRTVVLVGLMGVGKSAVGRRLARRLDLPFIDADAEIEAAAGNSIEELFRQHGEAEFRAGERRVIARLLEGEPHVLATGGGAFMDPETRSLVRARGISIWLNADLDTLVERVSRRNNRPLLKNGDARQTLSDLMAIRNPVYAEADITVASVDRPLGEMTVRVADALQDWIAAHPERALRPAPKR
ncbi:MAG: shikimate kinase [Rhodospirillaceae bacterium]|nr:shikimate kinase [Rhodospirillaceae bacterium]MYF85270.1 shikimate kinase [Rhodospirillaceae bacterium]MYH39346.1 shikimate kinase [Rhodospirillaceae bacterium]MYK13942.1 shikimate kinase [Rhodospirillaceae bacterium]